jgi:hypothetical protein
MLRLIAIAAAACSLAAAPALAADGPYKLDKNGKCHDAKGHFAKADMCKGGMKSMTMGPPAPAKATTGPAGGYKLDAKGKCHDPKGKMAKAEMCKA